jgi:hypothetical protein
VVVPPKPAFGPKRKLKVWVAGDSLAVVPGESILRLVGATRTVTTVGPVDGRIATGLERPDVFNWFTHVQEVMRQNRPKAVVLSFGANDDHAYMTGLPPGVSIGGFGSPSWRREYRRRVGGLMDTVIDRGGDVFWVGIPVTRSSAQSRRFAIINRIYRTEAAKRPGRVFYVDTYALFADRRGSYADYLPNASGELIRMRAPDGVHFARAGGDRIAQRVFQDFRKAFDLTSWRRRAAPTRPSHPPRTPARRTP